VAAARRGGGPQLVVAKLLRLCGHGEHDDAHYIDARLKASPSGRDCLAVAEEYMRGRGWADAETMQRFRQEATRQIEEAVAMVQREPAPDPFTENWCALASRHLSERFEAYPPVETL
jgi:pyruvate dehydrogenase E1 component alpha subunit/2-oxoisovalerate dehydrogenase E1 component alpha subunit